MPTLIELAQLGKQALLAFVAQVLTELAALKARVEELMAEQVASNARVAELLLENAALKAQREQRERDAKRHCSEETGCHAARALWRVRVVSTRPSP